MTEIVWGPEIAVDGKRPEQLAGNDEVLLRECGLEPYKASMLVSEIEWHEDVETIRLPADHPRYATLGTHTAPNTPAGYSDEVRDLDEARRHDAMVWDRMEALVRKCHDLTDYDHPVPGAPFIGKATTEDELWLAKEARAIVALLEPVDPIEALITELMAQDLPEREKLAKAYEAGKTDG